VGKHGLVVGLLAGIVGNPSEADAAISLDYEDGTLRDGVALYDEVFQCDAVSTDCRAMDV
ncbi:uncharacterized protein METZ01_LOCUS44881, partial [marine metagenome]